MAAFLNGLLKIIMIVSLSLSSLFQTGSFPVKVDMPDYDKGEYGQYVDPMIGTGGIPWASAMLFPGATYPFGMVKLSPDTTGAGSSMGGGNGGYYYYDTATFGFSHTRLAGTGAKAYGHFRVTPGLGDKADPLTRMEKPIIFGHNNEVSTAGYYAVNLPSVKCMAELTASEHTGVQRYTFDSSKDAHIFIDSTSTLDNGTASEGYVEVLPDANEVVGYGRIHTHFTGPLGLKAYYVARFDTDIKSYSTWNTDGNVSGRAVSNGNDVGADLNFGDVKGKPVELQLGISFVSLENARENLDTEAGTFDEVRAASLSTWDEWLSRVKIETPDKDIKTIFYTAMYHCMIMPTTVTDIDGQYLGFNGKISTADGFNYRSDLSLWDTFRTEHPLLTLIAPEIQTDVLNSIVEMAKEGGALPRWAALGNYTGSMLGTPSDMVIAESYLKGLTDFDVETAYEYMIKSANEEIPGTDCRKYVKVYNELGYVPVDAGDESVAHTLEYAWADGSIALLAAALGKTEDAAEYTERSLRYKNVFDPDTKYFRGKSADGKWVKAFYPPMTTYYDEVLPIKFAEPYCEGSAGQWRYVVPQDPQGLIKLFGSNDYFVSELGKFMAGASKNRADLNPGANFWLGNQHDMHTPYLFNEAGRADLTQKWVRWALENRHSTDVDGLDGNDDGGTLSSWYVFSSMGLYPVAGTDRYWIGAPIVDSAEIDMGNGYTLNVTAENQSSENIYVQSVTLNGVKLDSSSIVHSQIAQGGTLEFVMGSSPAANGGF